MQVSYHNVMYYPALVEPSVHRHLRLHVPVESSFFMIVLMILIFLVVIVVMPMYCCGCSPYKLRQKRKEEKWKWEVRQMMEQRNRVDAEAVEGGQLLGRGTTEL